MRKIITLMVLLAIFATNAQTTCYVKQTATGNGDGSMWATAFSDGIININTPTDNPDNGWTWNSPTLTITANGTYTITGSGETTNRIVIQPGLTNVNIILSGVNINVSGESGACAFDMTGATVNLTLTGGNTLISGYNRAGLEAPSGATLVIDGTGSLTAIGNFSSGGATAGIGGGQNGDGGTITINGGTITATGSDWGAGIGGGQYGAGGTITITGGTVTATGGVSAAGIGGGYAGAGGTITINGGTVTAIGLGSAGIGNGNNYIGAGGTLAMNGNAFVNASDVSDASPKTKGILFDGNSGTMYGDVTLNQEAEIPAGKTLSVPAGQTLTGNGTIINNGAIINNGTIITNGIIINDGTITNDGTIDNCNGTIIDNGIITGSGTITCGISVLTSDGSGIVYIKKGSHGDGSSWENAYPELAVALVEAKTNPNIHEIWVAAGTYKPLYKAGDGTTDRDKAFILVENVKIYGGFPTDANDIDHTTIASRTLSSPASLTILSGDIDGIPGISADDAYHVVIGFFIYNGILDGFTVTGGNADGSGSIINEGYYIAQNSGGGMYNCFYSSPTLTNVTISGNKTNGNGGGISNDNSSSPTLTNVTISGNTATGNGGGISNENYSSPMLTNVTISGNTANGNGGGISNDNSSPMLTNLTISGNTATNSGGGIYNSNSSPDLTNVIISGNSATDGGGIYIYGSYPTYPTIINVTISGNSATNGGGIYNDDYSFPQIYNSILWGNTATSTGANILNINSYPDYFNSLVQDENLGFPNLDGTDAANDPQFVSPIDASNAPTTAGNYRLLANSPVKDAGDNYMFTWESTDLDGNPRIVNGIIDIGAYEYQMITPDGNGIVYVKKDGNGDGSSWANACGELANAFYEAKDNPWSGINEIWVAAGTYYPLYKATSVDANNYPTTDRDKAFVLISNVNTYGGFPTDANDIDHTTIASRTLSSPASQTILSGDIDGIPGISAGDAYHVVIGAYVIYDNTVLDGFTVTGGNADGSNSIIVNGANIYNGHGGGIYNVFHSSPTLTNLTISGNTATEGGGIYNY
ncbi:MAG: carbohydrate-binding domain-containing protein, partial [Dysgonamonadaceae bacterium]|nr:carbohydrate-binding domain-containing protein [Dysgonamonadaceae bacterium]